jgi:hypothetical protein
MSTTARELEWLHHRTKSYRPGKDGASGVIKDLENEGKLGQGFSSVDKLDEVDMGDGSTHRPMYISANLPKDQKEQVWVDMGDGSMHRPTYISTNLPEDQKEQVRSLIKEFVDCFAWEYNEMSRLDRKLVEHRLSTKPGFRQYKQPPRSFSPILHGRIKEEIDRLLKARFIQPCRYA